MSSWWEDILVAGDDGDDEIGALVWTPAAIQAELDTVHTGVRQLDADVMASKVRQEFKNSWRVFVGEWWAYYQKNKGSWWGSTVEKAHEYRRRLDEWRSAFEREGGVAVAPSVTAPPARASEGPSRLAWLAGGALAVTAVLVWVQGKAR